MRGTNLPPHPVVPPGSEPTMLVEVPSARLTAQRNWGAWHLTRHAQKHPQTMRLRFRHPKAAPIQRVEVNGRNWGGFEPAREITRLDGLRGTVAVIAHY
jgi:hypothetical protein